MSAYIHTKYKVFIIIILLFISSSTYPIQFSVPDTIYENMDVDEPNEKYKFRLRKSFKGNFTNSGNEECISFYYWQYESNRDGFIEFVYQKIKIFEILNNKIIKQYNIYYEFLEEEYSPYETSIIKSLEDNFGKWNGYYYIFDLNRNGVNEIIIFPEKAGGHMVMTIYEFHNGRFIRLTPSRFDMDRMIGVSANVNDKSFTIKVPCPVKKMHKGYYEKKFQWNEKKEQYEVIQSNGRKN